MEANGPDPDHHEVVAQIESARTKEWADWCEKHPFVKCTEADVPSGILPKGYTGALIDVKVQARGKHWGPDDKIYGAHEDLRMKVARGNCILELNRFHGSKRTTNYLFLVFALRKFSGGMGDEDEDDASCQNMWQKFFIKPVNSAATVVATEKANGEAAHLGCRLIEGQTYFCLGSKNVHMLVRTRADIEKYKDSRYQVARTVADTFFSKYIDSDSIPSKNKEEFCQFMDDSRCTAIFELLQPSYQHVVDLSYLHEPELRFICWTENFTVNSNYVNGENNDCDSLCLEPPSNAINKAREFGLSTIEYEVISASQADDYMTKIRTERDYEGKVLYFMDDQGKVFGLIKKKTAWYIILRAIREKCCTFICSKNSYTRGEMESKITKRIAEIQKWLGFTDVLRRQWTDLGVAFAKWAVHLKETKPNSFGLRAEFPQLWKRFLDSDAKFRSLYDEL